MRATLAVLSLLLSTTGVVAEVVPAAGPKDDPHMQTVAYAPGQVFVLHLMVGRTAVLELPPEETNNQSFGSDSKFMTADIPAGTNLIFLKPVRPMAPKPFFVTATLADGHNKLYALEIDVTPAAGEVVLPYRVKFVDPSAVKAANVAAWRTRQRQKVEAEAKAALRYAVAHPDDTNPKYVLQGETTADWNLLPTREVGDDGRNTHFHFPGARAVEIYVIAPDGKKSVPDCSPDSETHITTCHQLAAKWRLEDGDAHLCIFNHAFDAVGTSVPSNTASPDYDRELRANR